MYNNGSPKPRIVSTDGNVDTTYGRDEDVSIIYFLKNKEGVVLL
jgi:hypothetical protein